MTNNYCEFIGNEKYYFDEIPKSKRICKWAGFNHCTYYDKPLKEDGNGWRKCCNECATPHYLKGFKWV